MKEFAKNLLELFVLGLGWSAFVAACGALARLNWELFMLGWGVL